MENENIEKIEEKELIEATEAVETAEVLEQTVEAASFEAAEAFEQAAEAENPEAAEAENHETADPAAKPKKAKKAKRKRRRVHEYADVPDIRYRGPLSYAAFRIIGWICIAVGQVVLFLNLSLKIDPTMTQELMTPLAIMETVAALAIPLLLMAHFARILGTGERHHMEVLRCGAYMLLIVAISVIAYHHYIVGGLSAFLESREQTAKLLEESINRMLPSGFIAYNVFVDLFLCSLILFFLCYRPKKIFKGKKLGLFRAFVILPILYEIAAIVLKVLSIHGLIELPIYVFPFLPTKSPVLFLVFICMSLFIKVRERIFLKNGRTIEEYRAFLKTNRNSFQFSLFAALLLIVTGILDLIVLMALMFSYAGTNPEAMQVALSIAQALGIGQSVMAFILAPLMLLFSYTRKPKDKRIDVLIPICGVAFVAFVIFECIFQGIKTLPESLPIILQNLRGGGMLP